MGGLIGGGKPDTSAARAQMEQQRLETEKLRAQGEEDKRDMAASEASRKMARTRGGSRMLLAEDRLNPESGLDETLGA
tara:strand:- start:929 stop:1162 length:234 start_codon:yes stop_codon:yes gene_type:complete